MKELDDLLQHAGVKGMKWGVVKSKVKQHVEKRKAKEKAGLEAYHKKNKDKFLYKRMYKMNGGPRNKNQISRIKQTRREVRALKGQIAYGAAVMAMPAVAKASRVAYKVATNPDNIRRGKNIIQALKRSPIRYVDGSKMTNVVNTAREVLR